MLKQKVDIRTQFDQKRVFYSLFREKDNNDRKRGALWCNLLKIKELKESHAAAFFAKISEVRNAHLEALIDKDTIKDRSDLLIEKKTNRSLKPEPQKLKKVIFAYGNVDSSLGYN